MKNKRWTPFETLFRSVSKAAVYRIGSLLTVTPLTAIFVEWQTTGTISLNVAAAFIAATGVANLVFNTLYYIGYERIASRVHRGYKIRKSESRQRLARNGSKPLYTS
ncbi:MAG: hypothetical protein KGH57_03650 [Candidatus Micrarchaeota archaeon]|nr:hypothetical protein [Candidatus Micrarchaeota archaeon]